MLRLFSPILFLVLLAAKAGASDYTAAATVWESFYAQVVGVDRQGNIALKQTLPTGLHFFTELHPTSNGQLLIIDSITTPYGVVYTVSAPAVFNKTQELRRLYYFAISSNDRYFVSYLPTKDVDNKLLLYIIENSQLQYTESVPLWGKSMLGIDYSKVSGTFIVNNYTDKTLDVYQVHPHGYLIAQGPAISYYPALGNVGMAISPDGRTCLILSISDPNIAVFRIHNDATITKVQAFSSQDASNVEWAAFTPDSRYALIWYTGGLLRPHELEIYGIERDGSLTKVDGIGGIQDSSGTIAVTPDGNFALLSHSYYAHIRQTLSTIRIHHDGTLTRLTDKDLVMYNQREFYYSRFIPPQVLGAYGLWRDYITRPAYVETFAEWQGGSVPGVFEVPESWRLPDGSLALRPTSTSNCFGFWQSPVDALMVVPYSVYRARYVIRASNSGPLNPERLPGLRLRTNAQTLQPANTLVLNSAPDGLLMTMSDPTTFTLFFEPPISSCSREETMDDVFCSLDLMAFNEEDDMDTTYVLSRMLVDRLPVECFDVEEVMRDYEFAEDAEGWTYGGAPGVFEMPQFSLVPEALLISAQGETNCFGFWNSDPEDVVTSTAAELYRATFYVRTDQPDRWLVPTFRLRLGTSLNRLITTQEILSANDSEMSPYYDSSDPARQFEYPVYLYKPETPEPLNLLLAFDLLAFDETDDADTLLILDRVRLERLTLPKFPLDD